MNLGELQRSWNHFGRTDPYWAILTAPDKKNNRWDKQEFFESGRYQIDEVMGYLATVAPDLRRGRAMDFGCGVGRLTQALAMYFERVTGVDIAPSMVERARAHNQFPDRCEFVLNERDDLKTWQSGTFDFVYSSITLQHMPPRYIRRYLTEGVRLLAPGGILLFQLPSRFVAAGIHLARIRHLMYRLQRALFPTRGAVIDMYGIPPEKVVRVLEHAGGQVLSVVPDGSAGAHWEGFRYCVRKVR